MSYLWLSFHSAPNMAEKALKVEPLLDWLVREPPEPKWLIKNLWPKQSVVLISGPRKRATKTWFAFDTTLCMASGTPVFGFDTTPTRVLCLEEEGTSNDTRSRILKLLRGRGLDPKTGAGAEQLKLLNENYKFVHHPRVKLDNPAWVKGLVNYVANEGIEVVLLDAITYMTSGDENSKQDMQPVVDACFALRAAGASVGALVHTNKQSQREDADPDLDVRGSTVLLDAYDAHFALRRHAEDHINLLCRYRDFEEQRFHLSWEFKPETVKGTLVRVTEASEERERLQDFVMQLLPLREYNTNEIAKTFGLQVKEAAHLLNSLVKCGALVAQSSGSFIKKG